MELSIEQLFTNLFSGLGIEKAGGIFIIFLGLIYILLDIFYKNVNNKFYKISGRYFSISSTNLFFRNMFMITVIFSLIVYILIDSLAINSFLIAIALFCINIIIMLYISNKVIKRFLDDYTLFNKDKLGSVVSAILSIIIILLAIFAYFCFKNISLFCYIKFIFTLFLLAACIGTGIIFCYCNKKCKQNKITEKSKNVIPYYLGFLSVYFGLALTIFTIYLATYISSNKLFVDDINKNTVKNTKKSDVLSMKYHSIVNSITTKIRENKKWSVCEFVKYFKDTELLMNDAVYKKLETKGTKELNNIQLPSEEKENKDQLELEKYINPDKTKYFMLILNPNGGIIEGDNVYWVKKGHQLDSCELNNTYPKKSGVKFLFWANKKDGNESALPRTFYYSSSTLNLYAIYGDDRDVISGSETEDILGKFLYELEKINYTDTFKKLIKVAILFNLSDDFLFIMLIIVPLAIMLNIILLLVADTYFFPSKKKVYEYVENVNNKTYFIIENYKNMLLCMEGTMKNNTNLNKVLVLNSESYKLISPNSELTFYTQEFEEVTILSKNEKDGIINGSKKAPKGFATVTFDAGEYGKIIESKTSYYVNLDKKVTLTAPTVEANSGYSFTGWNASLTDKFTADKIIEATYVAKDDIGEEQDKSQKDASDGNKKK